MISIYEIHLNNLIPLLLFLLFGATLEAQSVKIISEKDTLCEHDNLTLRRKVTGFSFPVTTKWYKRNQEISSDTVYSKLNLSPTDSGTYVVIVSDTTNLTARDSVHITIEPSPTFTLGKVDPTKCGTNTGQIIFQNLLKEKEYIIKYKLGAQVLRDTLTSTSSGIIIKDKIYAGAYREIMINSGRCWSQSQQIDLIDPKPPTITFNSVDEFCDGTSITLRATPKGGTFSIISPSGNGKITTDSILTNKTGNLDTIKVLYTYKDPATSCTGTNTKYITINPNPNIGNPKITDVSCNGGSDGKIEINSGYDKYVWSSPITTKTFKAENLTAGNYSVTVTDKKGCVSIKKDIPVTQPEVLKIENENIYVFCFDNNKTINISATGGTPGYSYSWQGPTKNGTTEVIDGDVQGNYAINISDSKGCIQTKNIEVKINSEIPLNIFTSGGNSVTNHFCAGTFIKISASSSPGAIYNWNTNETTQAIFPINSGTYTVKVTLSENDKMCSVQKDITVTKDPLPIFQFLNTETNESGTSFIICKLDTLHVKLIGNYDYTWEDNNKNTLRDITGIGNYTVQAKDLTTGCTDSSTFSLRHYNKADQVLDIELQKPNGIQFSDEELICYNPSDSIKIQTNFKDLDKFSEIKWTVNDNNIATVNPSKNSKEAYIKLKSSNNFILIIEGTEDKKGCLSRDTVKFTIISGDIKIDAFNYCGLIFIDPKFEILKPLPPSVDDLNNGFYYINENAKFKFRYNYQEAYFCEFTLNKSITNSSPGNHIILDDLVYDECGPHLLAKETTGNCYDWYKQNKKTLQLEKIDFQNNSWLKIKDTIDFRYVAISYNCKDTCESVVISQLTDKSNFIRCGNDSEQSVTIFPNPGIGKIYISLQDQNEDVSLWDLQIVDTNGKIVMTKKCSVIKDVASEIVLPDLPPGIYIMKLSNSASAFTNKIILN